MKNSEKCYNISTASSLVNMIVGRGSCRTKKFLRQRDKATLPYLRSNKTMRFPTIALDQIARSVGRESGAVRHW